MTKVVINPSASPLPYAAAITAAIVKDKSGDVISVEYETGMAADAKVGTIEGSVNCSKELAKLHPEVLKVDEAEATWIRFNDERLQGAIDFPLMIKAAGELNSHLCLRTFLAGNQIGLADILCWSSLRCIPAWNKLAKEPTASGKGLGVEVQRWFNHLSNGTAFAESIRSMQEAAQRLCEKKKDQASYDIDLVGAEHGKVVTRFPPEPSGYLHIGHAKAAMLNQYFAQMYGGKLIVRFDDTNPSNEESEFETSIMEDLSRLGIKGDIITYSSDSFDKLADYCRDLIGRGKAYADDTNKEVMNEQRFHGIPSKNRDLSPESSLKVFEQMIKGAEEAQSFCIRAKISVDNPNKTMRDPVIFRCNLTPHHRTGSKFKAYPTYDFTCPIVDSIEGVTHALRTNEYHDRNDQYYWILDALEMRKPQIYDYSRMNFVYTLLSKRKLKWFVSKGLVSGWEDPRFPTVRGILRRGLTVSALREYILMQGPSKNVLLLEWDKLWTINKKHIDPVAPRHVALLTDHIVKVRIVKESPQVPYTSVLPKHKKNPELGTKNTSFASELFLEQVDAATLSVGEEITLMDWGNVIVEAINREGDLVKSVDVRLHLEGDFKKTSKKFTWLAQEPSAPIPLTLLDYDYLITKKKLEEEDRFEDFVTPVSEFKVGAIGDCNLKELKKGDIIQLERKGFFICDEAAEAEGGLKLIAIPDGKAKSIASKA